MIRMVMCSVYRWHSNLIRAVPWSTLLVGPFGIRLAS
jgi:hypothetical protein